MATISVRRQLVYVKKTKNPRAPLPKRRPSSSDEMVGERAKPFAPLAAVPRRAAPKVDWRKRVQAAGMAVVGLAILAGAATLIGKSRPAYEDYAQPEIRPVAARPAVQITHAGNPSREEIAPVAVMQRETPTDRSFLASAYVRRKVSLPNISGNCTVGAGDNVAACLRRAAAEQ